jgi:DnaJ-class molecular chaperone
MTSDRQVTNYPCEECGGKGYKPAPAWYLGSKKRFVCDECEGRGVKW